MEIRKNHSQRKKDMDDAQNVTISGDTKYDRGKTMKVGQVPGNMDNHADII